MRTVHRPAHNDDDDDWEEHYEDAPARKVLPKRGGGLGLTKDSVTAAGQNLVNRVLEQKKKKQSAAMAANYRLPRPGKTVSFDKRPNVGQSEPFQPHTTDVEPIRVTNI